MNEFDPDIFAECSVRFALNQDEWFAIKPVQYLGCDHSFTFSTELLGVDCELRRKRTTIYGSDYFYLSDFVRLRDYLKDIKAKPVGDTLDISSERRFVVMMFMRKASTISMSGKIPDDDYAERVVDDIESYLQQCFLTQTKFRCNFPFDKIPEVVEQMNHVLRVSEKLR